MRTSTLFAIFLFFITQGCESIFNNENNEEALTAIIQNDTFIIKNNLPFDVYFFAVDQETSYLIDWIPIESETNRIKAGSFRKFPTDVIVGYTQGKTAIAFFCNGREYWNTLIIDEHPEL